MSFDFQGRTVAVSGAAIGFGRGICEAFAAAGARVYGCDIRAADLQAVARDMGVTTQDIDLTDRHAAAGWIRDVERLSGGAIDVLVNNAGGVAGQAFQPLEEVEDADWDRVMAVNLGAAMALSRAATPGMKAAGRGAIVNIGSGASLQASLTGVQAYCAAKHAILGLTRQLAQELGPHGVRVNCVAPGFVQTNEATARQWAAYSPERREAMVQAIPLRRFGTPQDIARATLFLASDEASFITGQILSVNGGR
ncbi:MAG: SDR family oxidoreductase [Proteobacteria bacterium]|nr:SDR family oxidoreductase [Pseudomonadota bacterium]